MRRFAFAISIFGLLVLALLLNLIPIKVENYSELDNFEINQKVILEGKIMEERILFEGTKMLVLDNGIELICECNENFKGKNIEVAGVVEEYNGKKQVRVLKIFY